MKKNIISFGKFYLIFCLLCLQIGIAKNYYGAIYVDEKTGIAGTAWNYETDNESKKTALKYCKKNSKKKYCELISGWFNSCSAAAWSPKNKSARTGGINDDKKQAEKQALRACINTEKDPSCKLVASVCTKWETWETTTTTTWW